VQSSIGRDAQKSLALLGRGTSEGLNALVEARQRTLAALEKRLEGDHTLAIGRDKRQAGVIQRAPAPAVLTAISCAFDQCNQIGAQLPEAR